MKRLLHIVASPRGDESRTLKISQEFLRTFLDHSPQWEIDTLNVFTEAMPSMTVKRIEGKYVLMSGENLSDELNEEWKEIVDHIERFLTANAYLISTPMWNFNVPYMLKQYIDVIIQPKYLFRYAADGTVEGLAGNKKMVVITTRGGDYGPQSPVKDFDFQEPYLRTVFGFVGLTDIVFINAQPMDALGPEVRQQKLSEAMSKAREIAASFV